MSSVYAANEVRNVCIIEKGEESWTDLIEAHKDCMKGYLKINPRYVAKLASFTGKNM
uniref:Uncharacterized protein n=1 Tax=Oncorhynchus mykiss TaxID=8022 RepID=A0A8C7U0V9_ONCMY